ncbi:MAG: ABC transporter permease [Candidatus Cloacimonetes bacterium]|jgi:hypothetical protein|nr:ABC transporter permease [Candidatus Cloacimonadota bacterium]MDD2507301.1 ABC transporter permease [Candidatus Cloacimonadota bacterium]MDD4560616.1 ABC transporter permease [Candidatus Cloacimonadota bacterium]
MILKHIKLSFRQIIRQKFSFAIAILGLALGLAAAGHLISYTLYYLDYDQNVENQGEWYRLRFSDLHPEFGELATASFFIPPAAMLLDDIPEVLEHIVYWPSVVALNLRCDDKPFQMPALTYVSEIFPKHYQMEIKYGNPDSLLSDRSGILISESFAQSFFGNINPVGKQIYVGDIPKYHISGVFADLRDNLHLKHDHYILWPEDTEAAPTSEEDWYITGHVRVRIAHPEETKAVERRLNEVLEQYRNLIGQSGTIQVHLDPIRQIHFMPNLKDDAPTMPILNIVSILVLAGLLIISAMVNFLIIIGLSWKKRSDEFYFRRAVGAGRAEIFGQLICEYGIYIGLALLIGIILYSATMGIFEDLVKVDVSRYSMVDLPYSVYSALIFLVLALVSGILMSWRHSRIKLDQNTWQGVHRNRGITVLLFVQMTISFALIAVAVSMYLHYSFVRGLDWGWDHQNTVQYKFISIMDEGRSGYSDARVIRQRIRELPGVLKESVSNFNLISESLDNQNGFHEVPIYLQDAEGNTPIRSYLSSCTPDFFETRGIKLVSGQIPDTATDTQVVVNQSFADKYLVNPVGSRLREGDDLDESNWYEVVAVAEDCWWFPPYQEMIPLITILKPYVIKYHQITWREGMKQEVLSGLEHIFAETASSGVFGYSSQEVELSQAGFYEQDLIYKNISMFMAIFVVLIAVMGVYAVSAQSIHAQMKDISIRKICGAEMSDLQKLYFRSYLYLYIASALPGLYLASNLIRLYIDKLALDNSASMMGYPAAILIMIPIVFVPLSLNIFMAYKADPTRYLQAD